MATRHEHASELHISPERLEYLLAVRAGDKPRLAAAEAAYRQTPEGIHELKLKGRHVEAMMAEQFKASSEGSTAR